MAPGRARRFLLEDKGWTLAIHAKDATEIEAETVLGRGRQQANSLIEQERGIYFVYKAAIDSWSVGRGLRTRRAQSNTCCPHSPGMVIRF